MTKKHTPKRKKDKNILHGTFSKIVLLIMALSFVLGTIGTVIYYIINGV